MKISLAVRNFVIVGEFIPSKFDKYYFLKNDIFEESDILDSSVFSTEFCQLSTNKFSLLILPNQLVLTELVPENTEVLSNTIEKISFTSDFVASAMGYNVHYYMYDDNIKELARKYFYNENISLAKNFFDTEDANFGYYASKNFKDSRLKLDIKPNILKHHNDNREENILIFAFNFHRDLNIADYKNVISNSLKELESYGVEIKKIMSVYEY
jgi:hypothetical protein